MEIYTGQMNIGKRKDLPEGIEVLDITVKSGLTVFAPSWDFLMEYKRDGDWAKYTEAYHAKMKQSLITNREDWIKLITTEKILLLCYCRAGKECHRHLLAQCIIKLRKHNGLETTLKGEITCVKNSHRVMS